MSTFYKLFASDFSNVTMASAYQVILYTVIDDIEWISQSLYIIWAFASFCY